MARGLNFRIYVVEGLYYPYSENKGADQLCSYCPADLRLCLFSHMQKAGFLITRLILWLKVCFSDFRASTSLAMNVFETCLGQQKTKMYVHLF